MRNPLGGMANGYRDAVEGVHRYLAHGLVLESQLELPMPELSGGWPADIVLGIALENRWNDRLESPLYSRPNSFEDPSCFDHWTEDGLIVEFVGQAAMVVTTSAVTVIAQETDDADLLAHLVLDHVLPRIVSLRGDLMLHGAGGVGPSGLAHVFLGDSGTGKSTLGSAMAAQGWPLVDDDGIRVINVDGRPYAVPGYAGVRLLPDSAKAILPLLAPGRPMARGHRKRRFVLAGAELTMAPAPAPIGALYILERTRRHRASIERLGLGASAVSVIDHGFHLASAPSDVARQAFTLSADLAATVPVWRLLVPPGLSRMTSTVALLHELDAALASSRI